MLAIGKMIRTAVEAAGDGRIVVAAPFDLAETHCRDLIDQGRISGYVANGAPAPDSRDPRIAGWWIDRRRGSWFIRSRIAPTMAFLGADADQDLDANLLLEARRKGVRRILLVGLDGAVLGDVDVRTAPIGPPGTPRSRMPAGDLTFERLFEELHGRIGNRLRLPLDGFVSNRLLLIVGSLGPGGAERQAAYTAAGLARRGTFDVHVGVSSLDPPADFFKPAVEAAGAKVHTVKVDSPEYNTFGVRELRRRLARYDVLGLHNMLPVIFHYALLIRAVRPAIVHTWMDYCNVLAGIAAELVGVPVLVLGGRSVAPDQFPELFQPYMRPGYMSILSRRNALLLNNSRAGAADYARWLGLPCDGFRVVHNGFEFPAEVSRSARTALRHEYGIPDDVPVVGSIARFSEEKRPQLFIDMARIVHDRCPKARFLLFGAGPMLAEMRSYVEACGLSDVIRLPGITGDAWSALAAMDVFALTSRIEGLPNVLVEAQASGLPVVCTGVGGMGETFVENETGFAVRSASPETLADAVSRLIGDRGLRARMSAKAFRHARDIFGIDKMLADTLEAYDDPRAGNAVRVRQELAPLCPQEFHPRTFEYCERPYPEVHWA